MVKDFKLDHSTSTICLKTLGLVEETVGKEEEMGTLSNFRLVALMISLTWTMASTTMRATTQTVFLEEVLEILGLLMT